MILPSLYLNRRSPQPNRHTQNSSSSPIPSRSSLPLPPIASSSPCNQSYDLSSRYSPKKLMYEYYPMRDNSFVAKNRAKLQQIRKYHANIQLVQKYQAKREEKSKRLHVIRELQDDFKVRLPSSYMYIYDTDQLKRAGYHMYNRRIEHSAAIKIQRFWKKCMVRLEIQRRKKKELESVINLQRAWIRYKLNVIIPREHMEGKLALISAYSNRKNYQLLVERYEMEQNFKYFEDLRWELLKNAGKVIRKYWMNYKLRKTIQERVKMKKLALERAMQAAENTIVMLEKKVQHRNLKNRFNREGRALKNIHKAKENLIN